MSHSFALSCLALLLIGTTLQFGRADELDVWIGTSAAEPSRGIYHCLLNTEKGQLTTPTLAAEIRGPGFLAMHPDRHTLYAVGTLEGEPSVVAYEIQGSGANASLKLRNAVAIGDGGAAHVAVDPTGRTLVTAQYGGGSVGVFSLAEDGSVQQRTQLHEHSGGSGAVPGRQDASHAHWAGFSPDNRFVFVPDLGLDQVVIYSLDTEQSLLSPHGHADAPRGGGPRHMKFHTSGRWAYLLNELALSVSVYDYDAKAGTMTLKQTIPTVDPEELAQEQFASASEIRVHPSGKFVYSANRGHDTISVFRVDSQTGELSLVEVEHVRGATPRNFNLAPDGSWLLAAGQDSHTLAVFAVDPQSGELTYNRSIVHAPAAICVLFGHE